VTFYANDTAGNLNYTIHSWDYKVFENSRTFNSSTFETKTETYLINVTANSSLTAVKLFWNSTNYSLTNQGSGIWSFTRDMPIGIGTFPFNFQFVYDNELIISDNSTQEVNLTLFTPINSTYPTPFLNITFKDENTLTPINASVPTSTFTYYLGTGSVNKTLVYSNTTNNFNYTFAGTTGSLPLKVDAISFQYKQGTDYPQRIWEPTLRTYNSTMTTQVLYLLKSTDGIYVTYQVVNSAGQPISNVDVEATRIIEGETVVVGIGQTDNAGLVTFWMNPDFVHTVTFQKSGYQTFTLNHFPTQSSYTIILSSGVTTVDDFNFGVNYFVSPKVGTDLEANTNVNFNFTINSTYWNLTSFQFTLYNQDNVIIGGNSSSGNYGTIINIINVSNNTKIRMVASWIINGTETKVSYSWNVFNSSVNQWSLKAFFEDLSLYSNQGMFGLNKNNLALIVFLIIFITTGIISYKFGLTSPAVISSVIFILVFLFDYILGMIPSPIGAIENLPTVIMAIIMISLIIKEVTS